MVYTGNQAVLFGGTDGNEIFHNPWGWRGTLWPQHQNMGPPNRGLNSMAYDRDRNVVVIFDGGDINRDLKMHGSTAIKEST